jgi:sugar phosphate isomerase/epimerase
VLADCSPSVGAAIDTGHFAFLGCDLLDVARTLAPRAMHVHLKVVQRAGRGARWLRRFEHRYHMDAALPGPRDQLDRFLPALRAQGYSGTLAIEHEDPSPSVAMLAAYRDRALGILGESHAPAMWESAHA